MPDQLNKKSSAVSWAALVKPVSVIEIMAMALPSVPISRLLPTIRAPHRGLQANRCRASRSRDFVHGQCACGCRFRILNLVDEVARECLAEIPDTAISGRRVATKLTALIERCGKPGGPKRFFDTALINRLGARRRRC